MLAQDLKVGQEVFFRLGGLFVIRQRSPSVTHPEYIDFYLNNYEYPVRVNRFKFLDLINDIPVLA